MIQEPINDLQKILGEPVDEVTAEYPAMPDPARKLYRDDHNGYARHASCLRSRLTVKLVALDQDHDPVGVGLVSALGADSSHDHNRDSVGAGFISIYEAPTLEMPAYSVPTQMFAPASFGVNGEVEAAPAFSVHSTPEPDPNILTPVPEENDYAEDDDADMGEFYPYMDTPTPEPDANRGPYTPTPEKDSWLYREAPKLHTARVSSTDAMQPIILPMKAGIAAATSMDLIPVQTYKPERQFRFDPALTMLTFLLLLGILGGIGFGYLLTIVYQG